MAAESKTWDECSVPQENLDFLMSKDPEVNKVMEYVAERNRTAQRLAKAGAPRVGIFWFIQEPGQPPTILADTAFVEQGKTEGNYIRGFTNHDTAWRALKRIRYSKEAMRFLDDSGPDDLPRGRVVFNTAVKCFEVYLHKQLVSPEFEQDILAHFHLTAEETSFTADPSYTAERFTFGPDGPLSAR